MPRVYTKIARKNIYAKGAKIPSEKTKSGYRIDRSKPFDENDKVLIPAGSTYYEWTFYKCPTIRSLTKPKPSQLTRSEFLSTVYSWQENISESVEIEDVEAFISERIDEINTLRDETEDKLYNMPEQLQYAPTGELLQNRMDSLDEMISELEAITIDEDSDLEEVNEEINSIIYQGE